VQLTPKQHEAEALIGGQQTHTLLVGGSRSGKTLLCCLVILARAIAAPGSRHAILRYRFNAVKQSIGMDTLPKALKLRYPELQYREDKQNGVFYVAGSEIWLGGLDDKERTEKILGLEFATIYANECSQIPWSSIELVRTRLAQVCTIPANGATLRQRMLYDCNPPSKGHWTYRYFVQGKDPTTNQPLANPGDVAWMRINPEDNLANLPPDYVSKTLGGMSARQQKRFLRGEFADATPNALFREENIDTWRVMDGKLPEMIRIVVAVDPSGSGDVDNADNDAIGIVVAGLGTDGNAYVIEDSTVKAGPATWGRVACSAYDRHAADVIVGEGNYGGAMVEATIQAARRDMGGRPAPYKMVTATRGKAVRAEPIAALYETGKVRHVGYFSELEDELMSFSTVGYIGERSPNRADAAIWALTELFPGIVAGRDVKKPRKPWEPSQSWMAT
jgi:phage terminase large subunit-like protein